MESKLLKSCFRVSYLRKPTSNARVTLALDAGSLQPGYPLTSPTRIAIGGAEEDRTPDLLRARQALSQLSYGPGDTFARPSSKSPCERSNRCCLVGLGGFEPPTSPLSGVRSNQLSYRPSKLSGGRRLGGLPPNSRKDFYPVLDSSLGRLWRVVSRYSASHSCGREKPKRAFRLRR
jgi:hypothetical protein